MRLTVRLLALASLCAPVTLAAHADTFSLTNYTFASGATATGTIDIDTTTGQVISQDIIYSGLPSDPFDIASGQGNGGDYTDAPAYDAAGDVFAESFPTDGTFIGYTGGLTCSDTHPCDLSHVPLSSGIVFSNSKLLPDDLLTGSLTLDPPTATPEPSSLALFGTGILGLAGMARRRGFRLK